MTFTMAVDSHSDDVRRLHDLLQSEYVGMYGEPDPDPDARLELLLAREGSVIVGFVTAGVLREAVGLTLTTYEREGTARLHRVYTHFDHRGRGYAATMIGEAERRAREAGMRRIELETGRRQVSAIRLYLGLGYGAAAPFGYYAESPESVFLGKDL